MLSVVNFVYFKYSLGEGSIYGMVQHPTNGKSTLEIEKWGNF